MAAEDSILQHSHLAPPCHYLFTSPVYKYPASYLRTLISDQRDQERDLPLNLGQTKLISNLITEAVWRP